MEIFKGLQVLSPDCNLDTVRDGRGGIFTWYPNEPIVEFNMLYFRPGKTRGFHYHPHFIEYLLITEGSGLLVARPKNSPKSDEQHIHLSKGVCTRTETEIFHTVYAITDMTIVAMLSRKWDDCHPPIIRE